MWFVPPIDITFCAHATAGEASEAEKRCLFVLVLRTFDTDLIFFLNVLLSFRGLLIWSFFFTTSFRSRWYRLDFLIFCLFTWFYGFTLLRKVLFHLHHYLKHFVVQTRYDCTNFTLECLQSHLPLEGTECACQT